MVYDGEQTEAILLPTRRRRRTWSHSVPEHGTSGYLCENGACRRADADFRTLLDKEQAVVDRNDKMC